MTSPIDGSITSSRPEKWAQHSRAHIDAVSGVCDGAQRSAAHRRHVLQRQPALVIDTILPLVVVGVVGTALRVLAIANAIAVAVDVDVAVAARDRCILAIAIILIRTAAHTKGVAIGSVADTRARTAAEQHARRSVLDVGTDAHFEKRLVHKEKLLVHRVVGSAAQRNAVLVGEVARRALERYVLRNVKVNRDGVHLRLRHVKGALPLYQSIMRGVQPPVQAGNNALGRHDVYILVGDASHHLRGYGRRRLCDGSIGLDSGQCQ